MASIFSKFSSLFTSDSAKRTPGTQSSAPGQKGNPQPISVTQDTALALSAFWAGSRLISESIGAMPIKFYNKNDDGTQGDEVDDHPVVEVLKHKPNQYQTTPEFFETLAMCMAVRGNSYCVKQTNSKGRLIGLLPLMPEQMKVGLKRDTSQLLYEYQDGVTVSEFQAGKIWHNKLFGNGVIGLSPLHYGEGSIGIGLSGERTTTKVYKNDGKPAAALETDNFFNDDQRKVMNQRFSELTSGNTDDNLFILELGMKYKQVSLSPQDLELLGSRSFQIEEVCRFLGVPPILIGHYGSTTTWGSAVHEIISLFYKFGLRPYINRLEKSIIVNLFDRKDWDNYIVRFDFDDLLRVDLETRMKAAKEGVQGGVLTPNDGRKLEGLPPKDGGDVLYMQQQMTPITQLPAKSEKK